METDEAGQLRSLIEDAPFAMSLRDLDGRFTLINARAAEMIGQPAGELLERMPSELFAPATAEALERQAREVAESGLPSTHELNGSLPDGVMRDYFVTNYPVRDGAGEIVGVGGISLDITSRKQVENTLREAEDRFRGAFDAAAIGKAIVAPDGRFLDVNLALCELLGYDKDALLAATFQEITHTEDLDADLELVRQVLAGEITHYQLDKRYIRRDGETIWGRLNVSLVRDADGAPVHFVSQIMDISQEKRAEELTEQLRHSQKLDAIGRLAGGVAHDFNNMLTAIQGYSELLLAALAQDDPRRRHAEQISRAAGQASTLPRQLLAFSRKQPARAEVIDINHVMSGASDMLRRLVGEKIAVEVSGLRAAGPVLADPGHVEQVLVNLVVNAGEAMPDGGTVRIAARSDRLSRESRVEPDAAPGPYIVVTVTDEGEGIDPGARGQIFEPFFTTKLSGTGLGLSTVYGIVRQSGGFVRVESEVGAGSCFEVWLPRALAEPTTVEAPAGPQRRAERHIATVLLAEDESVVRDLAVLVLSRAGYRVLAAPSGEAALELSAHCEDGIDVLVADMVMPGISGGELARRVVAERPGTPVVLMSGYTEEIHSLEIPGTTPALLQKPFAPSALVEAVAEALEPPVRDQADASRGTGRGPTCLVADDHPAVLDAVSDYLQANGIRVIGRASRGDEALARIESEQPSLALLDVRMEPLTGIEVARRAGLSAPGTQVVLFTGHGDRAMLSEALDAGARGFVLKESPLPELLRALTEVACGGTFVSPGLEDAITHGSAVSALSPLTSREREILALVADGMTNDKAANALGISAETVQSHVRHAMAKLDADTRTQAVATAFRRSLLV